MYVLLLLIEACAGNIRAGASVHERFVLTRTRLGRFDNRCSSSVILCLSPLRRRAAVGCPSACVPFIAMRLRLAQSRRRPAAPDRIMRRLKKHENDLSCLSPTALYIVAERWRAFAVQRIHPGMFTWQSIFLRSGEAPPLPIMLRDFSRGRPAVRQPNVSASTCKPFIFDAKRNKCGEYSISIPRRIPIRHTRPTEKTG